MLEIWDPLAVYYELPGTRLDDELVDAGDKVICVQRWTGTGRGSGLSVDLKEVVVYKFENGKIIEGRVYPDRRSALEAAGPSE